jgi:DNA-binding CsgD family transcriptional regulator
MPQQVIDGKRITRTRFLVTSREKEILDLISLGFSTDEIANDLFLSSETIRTHRKSLLQKFKARNTAQLIRIAFEFGVLRVSL